MTNPDTAPPGESTQTPTTSSGPRGRAGIAWIVIAFMALLTIGLHLIPQDADAVDGEDPIGLLMMQMQAQYIVGSTTFAGNADKFYEESKVTLDVGTLGQRQRFVVLAAELQGGAEAGRLLDELDGLIEDESRAEPDPFEPSARELAIQAVLRKLYPASEESDAPPSERLSAPEQELLLSEFGWFGELALSSDAGESERDAILAPARRVAFVLLGSVIAMILAAGCGLVGLIVIVVLAFSGKLGHGFEPGAAHHGIYAETFALWMVLFLALQFAAGLMAYVVPSLALVWAAGGFLLSLVVLAWPRIRGVDWVDVKRDTGLILGRTPIVEPAIGVGGYFMALPLLAVGIGLTLLLITIQTFLAGPVETFAPLNSPAHPIVLELANGGLLMKLQVLLLASVAAPLVEETMFRGVLYRHLRDASAHLGLTVSVLLSGTINAFLFAAIHPQGWVAIPALMALAYSFLLLREWRGSLIPSMIVHGISNGLVMLMLISLLGG